MQSIFNIIINYRVSLTFLMLEFVALWLIFSKNPYPSNAFYSSSNVVVGAIYESRMIFKEYFNLHKKNANLHQENTMLKKQLETINFKKELGENVHFPDSLIQKQYDFIPSIVLQNSVGNANNYFVLNKGSADGVKINAGVYNDLGVLGIVKNVSDYYSTVYSLLHQNLVVSVIHKKSGELCSLQWNGSNTNFSVVNHLPKHVHAQLGDTLVTSGYSKSFVRGINIGIISSVKIKPNELFHTIELKFIPNFNSLYHVYVINKNYNKVVDSLSQE